MEVIIDLEKVTSFSEINTAFFQYNLSWIVLPNEVFYFISKNGKDFTEISNIKTDIPLMKEGKFKHEFQFESDTLISSRYIKLKAISAGKLPKEHASAGSDCWIFADEIIIK